MDAIGTGEFVKVTGNGPEMDGIVFDTPSHSKVVVAVMDPARGPRFQTVTPGAVTQRAEPGPHDHALRLLIKRTPPPVLRGGREAGSGAPGRSGYKRGTAHRSTGR
jgi:hypothetical protein